MILNLKALNERVEYKQFQMETLQTALDMVTKGAWFTSVDLRDAFYTLPISTDCRRYILKFCWREKLYCFQAAAMGLGPIPRIFSKLTKPALAHLRNLEHAITSFIDDSLLVGETQSETVAATIDTIKTFDSLGFLVHDEKSQLEPTQEITYLGFVINSKEMTVTLTEERKQKVVQTRIDLLRQKRSKVRSVASCIGLLVSSLPGVPLGQLHYRGLERDKNSALREKGGNWERYMVVSAKGRGDLLWRTQHLPQPRAEKEIRPPSVSLTTDSSQVGSPSEKGQIKRKH